MKIINKFALITTVFVLSIIVQRLNLFSNILNTKDSEIKIADSAIIVKKIQKISELSTIKYITEVIIPASKDGLIGRSRLLYIARGEVKAGIDLKQMNEENIKIDPKNRTIEVLLPPPQILNKKIDVNNSNVYEYRKGWFNLDADIAHKLQTQAQRDALKKITVAACKSGIIESANDSAELFIESILKEIGDYNSVNVKTQPNQICK